MVNADLVVGNGGDPLSTRTLRANDKQGVPIGYRRDRKENGSVSVD
jgi:hypothetical protein